MAKTLGSQFTVPYRDVLADATGLLTQPWQFFMRGMFSALDPLGIEQSFVLTNNLTPTAVSDALALGNVINNIEGLAFDSATTAFVVVEYIIQRMTSTNRAIEAGVLHLVFKPKLDFSNPATWNIVTVGTPGPDSAGITFSITSDGQVQYTSSNITGTQVISKITFRSRTLAAKNSIFSTLGGRG